MPLCLTERCPGVRQVPVRFPSGSRKVPVSGLVRSRRCLTTGIVRWIRTGTTIGMSTGTLTAWSLRVWSLDPVCWTLSVWTLSVSSLDFICLETGCLSSHACPEPVTLCCLSMLGAVWVCAHMCMCVCRHQAPVRCLPGVGMP